MLRPNGPDLLLACEFAPIGLSDGFLDRRLFFWRQFDKWLIDPRKLQQRAREFILEVVRQDGNRFYRLFEQLRHRGVVLCRDGGSPLGPGSGRIAVFDALGETMRRSGPVGGRINSWLFRANPTPSAPCTPWRPLLYTGQPADSAGFRHCLSGTGRFGAVEETAGSSPLQPGSFGAGRFREERGCDQWLKLSTST